MNSMNKPVVLFPMRLQIMKKEGVRCIPAIGGNPIVIRDLIKTSQIMTMKPSVVPRKGTISKLPAKPLKAVNLNGSKAVELINGGFASRDQLLQLGQDILDKIELITEEYNYYQIRWYPDTCQVFNPIRPVSDKETEAYQAYADRCTGGDEETGKAALADFINAVGSNRAKHILLAKEKGINPSDPTDAVNAGAAGKSFFKMLPDSVKLYTVKNVYITNGIPFEIKELQANLKPIPGNLSISLEELDPGSQSWINNFNEAVSMGMGVEVTNKSLVSQIDTADWLFVVGFSGDDSCDSLIRELFMRKRAAGSFEVIRQDSPTNNSEDEKSGYSNAKIKIDEFSENLMENSSGISATNILGAVFGFNDDQKREAFGYLKNGNSYDQLHAVDTFVLMYPGCTAEFWKAKLESKRYIQIPKIDATAGGTINHAGYETIINPAFNTIAASLHQNEFAISDDLKCYVSARGVVPPVLIDKNPYGILPVRSLPFWNFDNMNELDDPHFTLKILSEMFNRKRFESRYFGVTGRYNTLQSIADRMEANIKTMPLPNKIYTRILKGAQSFLNQDIEELTMPIVQEGDLAGLRANIYEVRAYLHALYTGTPVASIPQVFNESPLSANSLLTAIVKKSLLRMKELYDFGDYRDNVLNMLNQMKTAIDLLSSPKGSSVSEMEALVKETLDIFSPRYDAWMLALSARRLLITDRAGETIARNGIKAGQIPDVTCLNQNLTGVFGWLEKPGNAASTHNTDGYFQTPSANQTVAASMIRNASLYSAEGENPFMVNLSSQRYKEAVWFVEGLQKGYSRAELLGMRLERLLHDQGLDRLLYSLRSLYPMDQAKDTLKGSYLTNGEMFSEDVLDSKGFSEGDLNALKMLQNKIDELSDNVSDMFISEIAYNVASGNAEMANAWLSAFENKLPPPKVNMAGTVRTGQVLMQRVVMPLTGGEADAAEKNPRSIAEPALARLSDTLLSAFGYNSNTLLTASVYLRDQESKQLQHVKIDEMSISPLTDLGLSAFDIVLGGRKELDALAKRFVLHALKEKGQDVEDALKADNPEVAFDSKAFITFDYTGGMDSILTKASELLMVFKSSQPLAWEDIASAPVTGEGSYQIRVSSLKALYSRLERLSENYRLSLDELGSLKTKLGELMKKKEWLTRPGLAELQMKQTILKINALLNTFVKCGFQEANLYIFAEPGSQFLNIEPGITKPIIIQPNITRPNITRPDITRPDILKPPYTKPDTDINDLFESTSSAAVAAKLEALIERLGSRNSQAVLRDILTNPINETVSISYNLQQDCFEMNTGATPDDSLKSITLNVLLEKVQKQLKEWTSKDTMTILPPFVCQKTRAVSGSSSVEQLKLYRKVRKNISAISSLTDQFTAGLINSVWEPGVLEGVEAIKGMVMKNLGGADSAAVINDLKALKIDGRHSADLHYLLYQSGFTFTAGASFAGLKIDEWSDFVHNKSEVTGVGFKCQTPKSQAPNIILVAVPEYQYPLNSTGEWTHLHLARHMAETLRLMFIRTEGFNKEVPITADPSQPGHENAVFVDNAAPVMFVKSSENDPLLK